MDFHHQNDWFIQHFFKMLRFNVMDIHEHPSMAMTLLTWILNNLKYRNTWKMNLGIFLFSSSHLTHINIFMC